MANGGKRGGAGTAGGMNFQHAAAAWLSVGILAERAAGSLTPHIDSDSCAGALSGRHKTPPDTDDADLANSLLYLHLERGLHTCVACTDMGRNADVPTLERGQPRPQAVSPSSAPTKPRRPSLSAQRFAIGSVWMRSTTTSRLHVIGGYELVEVGRCRLLGGREVFPCSIASGL